LLAAAPFAHRAVLYGDDGEAAAVVAAQLLAAVARDDPTVVVLGPALRRAVEDLLGVDTELVHFRDLRDVHAESVEQMIANYLGIVDDLLRGGRVSTIVQYDPDHPHDGTRDFCYRVESAINIAAARRPIDNTCMYDLRVVSESEVEAARRTHPRLVVGGVEGPSPDFDDPPAPTFVVVGRAGLAALRAWVREQSPDVTAEVVEGLVLVVNEAVSAVVDHGRGAWVDLDRTTAGPTLRVSWADARLPLAGGETLRGELAPDHPLHDLASAVRVTGVPVRVQETPRGPVLEIGTAP
jgi:hypothetical protein